MRSTEIRRQFIAFFESKGHHFVPSSPVVPQDDPTLMFTNAGMNQFKPIFLGSERAGHPRVANTQKCIRAGGKHNDLDDVGKDTYHHTFFEMLGNWSFGDYFKKEAIAWAWELLTKEWGIDKRRLHATYFQGDPGEGLEPDSEAAALWRETTDIDPAHIHPGNKKDNFWEMGETGPCGPCSEIHIDLTADLSGGPLVNAGDARVMEIWNLVFIQFNRGSDGKLTPLPARHVDTGMGFERLCAVLQGMERGALGKVSNYDTDVFTPIFAAIQQRTGAAGYRGTVAGMANGESGIANEGNAETSKRGNADMPGDATEARSHEGTKDADQSAIDNRQSAMMTDVSYRVIADHVRCLVFALTDGAVPSNEGRGYVLRRILRRAVYYGRQYMDMHEPFLCDLVGPVVQHMEEAFPELRTAHRGKNLEHVSAQIRDEEVTFFRTLETGLQLFDQLASLTRRIAEGNYVTESNRSDPPSADRVATGKWIHPGEVAVFLKAGKYVIPGEVAFKLKDTNGFPLDLTELKAREVGLSVDVVRYNELMDEAREKGRRGSVAATEVDFQVSTALPPTDDSLKYQSPKRRVEAAVVGYVHGNQFRADGYIPFRATVGVLLDRTSFYAQQGGQVGDLGILVGTGDLFSRGIAVAPRFHVRETRSIGGAILHIGEMDEHSPVLSVGASVDCEIDTDFRLLIMKNHTATHVLNWALREVLEVGGGGKVDQKGSLVDPEKTRFDFSHHAPLTDEELERIEKLCGEQIAKALPVYAAVREEEYVDQRKAREINTLRAVFGEKYPDKVRVVSIGAAIEEMLRDPKNPKWMQYSVEFCGGTHVKNTAEIEAFALVGEEGVAKGVRRVVGVSGEAAKAAMQLGVQLLQETESLTDTESHEGTERNAETPERRNAEISGGALQGHEGTLDTLRQGQAPPRRHEGADSGGGDLGARIAAVQQRLAEVQIPILVRRRIQHLLAELQKEAKKQDKQAAADAGGAVMERVAALLGHGATIGGVAVVVGEVPQAPTDALRGAIDWVRNKTESSAVLLACVDDNKVTLLAGMSKAVVDRGVKAGDLIKEIAPLVGGKGGGRPDMAQGGGTDAGQLPVALEAARKWLAARLG